MVNFFISSLFHGHNSRYPKSENGMAQVTISINKLKIIRGLCGPRVQMGAYGSTIEIKKRINNMSFRENKNLITYTDGDLKAKNISLRDECFFLLFFLIGVTKSAEGFPLELWISANILPFYLCCRQRVLQNRS